MKGAHYGGTDSSLPAAAQVRTNPQQTHDGQQRIANVITELAPDLQWLKRLFLSQDSTSCGGHSSSGSTSSLSTPPSVSQSPPQPQLNGIANVGAAPAGLAGVAGLMGALGAGSALGMGGIVGALNGVIQTPAGTASPHTHTTGASTGVTLPVNNRCVQKAFSSLTWGSTQPHLLVS